MEAASLEGWYSLDPEREHSLESRVWYCLVRVMLRIEEVLVLFLVLESVLVCDGCDTRYWLFLGF